MMVSLFLFRYVSAQTRVMVAQVALHIAGEVALHRTKLHNLRVVETLDRYVILWHQHHIIILCIPTIEPSLNPAEHSVDASFAEDGVEDPVHQTWDWTTIRRFIHRWLPKVLPEPNLFAQETAVKEIGYYSLTLLKPLLVGYPVKWEYVDEYSVVDWKMRELLFHKQCVVLADFGKIEWRTWVGVYPLQEVSLVQLLWGNA